MFIELSLGGRQSSEVAPSEVLRYHRNSSRVGEENLEVQRAWNANAAFWDARMADGKVSPRAFPGQAILDVACGNGVTSRRLAVDGAQVTAIDFSESLIDFARKAEHRGGDSLSVGGCKRLRGGRCVGTTIVRFCAQQHGTYGYGSNRTCDTSCWRKSAACRSTGTQCASWEIQRFRLVSSARLVGDMAVAKQ